MIFFEKQNKKKTTLFWRRRLAKGFTLIELLMGAVIFMITVVTITGIFVSGVRIQKRFLAHQALVNEANRVTEYLSRSIRLAIEDEDGACIKDATGNPLPKYNYQTIDSVNNQDKLIFKRPKEENIYVCEEVFVEKDVTTNKDRIKIVESWPSTSYTAGYLTPSNIVIKSLNFMVQGDSNPSDNEQPKVTFSFEAEATGAGNIRIQSTVSQRNFDIHR